MTDPQHIDRLVGAARKAWIQTTLDLTLALHQTMDDYLATHPQATHGACLMAARHVGDDLEETIREENAGLGSTHPHSPCPHETSLCAACVPARRER